MTTEECLENTCLFPSSEDPILVLWNIYIYYIYIYILYICYIYIYISHIYIYIYIYLGVFLYNLSLIILTSFFIICGGWLDKTLMYLSSSFGFLYCRYVTFARLNVTSKKLISTKLVMISLLKLVFLKILIFFFLILSISRPFYFLNYKTIVSL